MKKITKIERVLELADQGKSLRWGSERTRLPAAFVQNWTARLIGNLIKSGHLWEYEKI